MFRNNKFSLLIDGTIYWTVTLTLLNIKAELAVISLDENGSILRTQIRLEPVPDFVVESSCSRLSQHPIGLILQVHVY